MKLSTLKCQIDKVSKAINILRSTYVETNSDIEELKIALIALAAVHASMSSDFHKVLSESFGKETPTP